MALEELLHQRGHNPLIDEVADSLIVKESGRDLQIRVRRRG
jgi:hypothetical protein